MRWFAWVWCAFVLWNTSGLVETAGKEWDALLSFDTQAKCVAQAQAEVRRFAAPLKKHWSVTMFPDKMGFLATCNDYSTCEDRISSWMYRCLPAGTPPVIK